MTVSRGHDGDHSGRRRSSLCARPAWMCTPPHFLPRTCVPTNLLSLTGKFPIRSTVPPPGYATPRSLTINAYRPNTIRYQSTAHVCRIISQTTKYSLNFFGSRSQTTTTVESPVPLGICKHMIRDKACAYGEYSAVGTVWKTSNKLDFVWPAASFQCFFENNYSIRLSRLIYCRKPYWHCLAVITETDLVPPTPEQPSYGHHNTMSSAEVRHGSRICRGQWGPYRGQCGPIISVHASLHRSNAVVTVEDQVADPPCVDTQRASDTMDVSTMDSAVEIQQDADKSF
ncbi:hypothetical protein COOONC_02002 [Cooperia oncophora]